MTRRALVATAAVALLSAPAALSATTATAAPANRTAVQAIEPLASYAPQTTCSPVAKPGVSAMSKLVMSAYPGTGSSGIVRACARGGRSEHKEGRAWDWRLNARKAADRAAASDFMAWLRAEDEFGNAYANARRTGVMYVVWNRKIWRAYDVKSGWRPYRGRNPHTDHMHISFSWAGARQTTSYWSGSDVPVPVVMSPEAATTTVATTPNRLVATDDAGDVEWERAHRHGK